MKNSTGLTILMSIVGSCFISGFWLGYYAHKRVTPPPINCPFPQSAEEMQTPPFDPTGTGEGPKG